ncbi:MAG TPA: SDR family NAD(P)-dependent oxidoreductase, partial [Mycobacterium sp.]|nr:SDR family NAD(P)-dependent oxidoreductase [Mycobacterium sp.]
MDNIRGKTIAITGAARGIGLATATALLTRGAQVIIGDRDLRALETAVAGLSGRGSVSGHPLDVTDRTSFSTFLDKARADGAGHIDVLINNAGVMPIGPFLDQSTQAIRSAVEVNFYGVLTGCQLVLPEMVERR